MFPSTNPSTNSLNGSNPYLNAVNAPLKLISDPLSPHLKVRFGQPTFNAEGVETLGPLFTRTIHWPGKGSGVTIGRGYDMKERSASKIFRDLVAAGLGNGDAELFSQGALLTGAQADAFVHYRKESFPVMPLAVQKRLFEDVVAPEMISDISRILKKPDVTRIYGGLEWNNLSKPVQELLFDLRYRGDYKGETRRFLQPLLVAGDMEGLRSTMENKNLWRSFGVPEDRIRARIDMAKQL